MNLKWICLPVLVLAACSSSPKKVVSGPGPVPYEKLEASMQKNRNPSAMFSDEDRWKAYGYLILTSTKQRIEAMRKGDWQTVCNASKNPRGIDTMLYYLAFEQFQVDSGYIYDRLQEQLGPFGYNAYRGVNSQRLAVNLHHACVDNDETAIGAAMKAIQMKISEE